MSPPGWSPPVHVRQAWGATGVCSYMIVCGQTRVAAVIDPHPTTQQQLQEWLADPGLRLRLELRTHAVTDRLQEEHQQRLDALVQRIGLSTRHRAETPSGPPPWEALRRTRVVPVGFGQGGKRVQLQAGDAVLEIPAEASGGAAFTVIGPSVGPLSLQVDRVRIAFGAHHIQVFGVAGPTARLGFLIQDCLFFGGSLRSAAAAEAPDATPKRFLELPDDTLLYPAHAPAQIGVATVAQERRWAAARATLATLDDPSVLEEGGFLESLSQIDSCLTPQRAPQRVRRAGED